MTLPAVPASFQWIDTPHGSGLVCRPLESIAPHLFTTRTLQLSSASDWHRVASEMGVAEVVTMNQVHGRHVVVVRRGSAPPARQDGDALVSDDPGVAIAVRAADCAPILLADATAGVVAAVHAGWRGTAAGVLSAAVEAMGREFGTRPGDLVAAIGPAIGACCYEVGSDLVDAFAAAGHARHLIDRWFLTGIRDPGSGIRDRRSQRLFLDVAGANRDQLRLAGVPDAQIHACGLCTAMHLEVLTSYRAEKEGAGRLAGVIRCRR